MIGYLPAKFPHTGEMVDVADRQLLAAVIHSSDHILRPLLPPDVQVYAVAGMNLPFQRKTIATLFLGFFFVL